MEIKHIEDKGSFINNEKEEIIAELTYRKEGNKLYFDHTFVSPSLRGQGIADKLLNAGVEYAEKNGYKIVPVCSYVVKKFQNGKYDFIKG